MTPKKALRRAGLQVAVYLGVVVGLGIVHPAPQATLAFEKAPAAVSAQESLSARYHCSVTGLPQGTIPGGSLVRKADESVVHTTFDAGWAAYQGTGPGTLLAVCRL